MASVDTLDATQDELDQFVQSYKKGPKVAAPQASSSSDDELDSFVKQFNSAAPQQQATGSKIATPDVVAARAQKDGTATGKAVENLRAEGYTTAPFPKADPRSHDFGWSKDENDNWVQDPAVIDRDGPKSTIPITPFAPTVPTTPLSTRAASLGQPSIELEPPPTDTSKIPLNVFTNQPQAPGMDTAEEAAAKAPRTPPKSRLEQNLEGVQGFEQTAKQNADQLTSRLMQGSKNVPLPYYHPDGTVRTMKLGDFTKLTDEYMNDPSIPKTTGTAFAASYGADIVKTLNDIYFSPIGIASTVTGVAAARALQTAGKGGTEALKALQEYQAMKEAGASEAELAMQKQLIDERIASVQASQRIAVGAQKGLQVAGRGFMAQGADQFIHGIQRKDWSQALGGFAGIVLGSRGELGGGNADVSESVKEQTAKMAVDNLKNETPVDEGKVPFTPPGEKNVTTEGSHEIVRQPQLPAPTEEVAPEAATAPRPTSDQAATPTPVGAGEELTPEKPETVKAQVDALAEGTNPVVYIPKGQENAPEPPHGAQVTEVGGDEPGAGTYYHDDSITPQEIKAAVKDGSYGELLGNVQTKEEATGGTREGGETPSQPVAVTARDDKGNEVQSSLVAGNDAEAQTQQAANLSEKFPNAKVGVETPEQVVQGRQSSEVPTAPQTAASRETPQADAGSELDNFVQEFKAKKKAPAKSANAYGKQHAQLYANRLRNPIEREYAQSYVKAKGAGKKLPTPSRALAPGKAKSIAGNVEEHFAKQAPQELSAKYSPEILTEAHEELRAAYNLASSFEKPGRYHTEGSAPDEAYAPGVWYGVGSSRHLVAEHYPWYADIPQGADKIGELLEKGKGAEYNRVIDKVAAHVQREKESAAPVIAEFAPKLKELSKQLAESDPELSETLAQLADGDGRGFKNLRQYVEEKISDAEQAKSFFTLIDNAAEEAREAGVGEPSESSSESRADESEGHGEVATSPQSAERSEGTKAPESPVSSETPFNLTAQKVRPRSTEHQNVIPGFEQHVEEQKAAAGRVQGERLTEEANRPLGNVESSAGDLERNSPLFRGSGASAQRSFSATEPPAKVGDRVSAKSGPLKGRPIEVTKVGATGVYGKEQDDGPIRFLKAGEFGPLLDSEGKPITTGPGTPLRDAFDTTGTRIQQLAQTIRENISGSKPISERMDYADKVAEQKAKAKDETDRALGKVKGAMAAMWDAYVEPPKWTDYEDALGKYQGAVQKSAFGLKHFAAEIKKAVPDPKRREAITNFIEAAGDRATLERWAEQAKPRFKAGYKAALDLTNVEQTIARNIIATQDERFELDKAAGLLEHEVDNYVMHAWKRENPYTKKLVSNVRAQMLQTKPSFTKQRVFGTFFDGEKAGYTPVNKDIGFLFAAREHSADQAIAARAFIKSMLEGKAADGRPLVAVSGSGQPIKEGEEPAKAYLIDAKTKPEDVADYHTIDHPALRKWTWATNDSKGNPIYVKGDMVVHPDAYPHLKNVLGKSALRSFAPFHAFQAVSSHFKSTLLSFSAFHQNQESLHAIFHRVNPATTKPIDFSNPKQAKLIDHGLQVASFDAQQAFGEGLGAGVPNRLPLVGKYLQRYNEYLFGDFIPRLKMAMAEHALERNFKRYRGKISDDQIYAQTANQANAAFGELNYTMMGRNKTMQDVLRMALLAPDFLEARGRFVGQALKPYGAEQLHALLLGALGLYVGARLLNQLLSGNPQWESQNAFDVVYKGRAYTLRSVPADIMHLFTDPRGFVYNRLNPIYGKAAIEGITGRDQYGRKQSVMQQAKDVLGGGLPIPIQGYRKDSESGPLETVLSSTGISTFPYKSPAERLARQYSLDTMPLGEQSKDRKDANQLARHLEDRLRKKQISAREVAEARKEGKITSSDQKRILARAARTPLQNSFRSLTPQQAMNVWDKADDEEKKQIRPLLANKLSRVDSVPQDQRAKLKAKIFAALHGAQRKLSEKGVPLHAPAPR